MIPVLIHLGTHRMIFYEVIFDIIPSWFHINQINQYQLAVKVTINRILDHVR